MRIFLVGYMGSGKSTLGKKIANSLSYKFIDTDTALEKKLGKSIPDLFNILGEDNFRKEESALLKDVINSHKEVVVSTGGGAPCYEDNMTVMNNAGFTIFLDLPVGMLIQRLKNGRQKRPLLINKNLDEFVPDHLALRRPFYSQSKVTIDANWLNSHHVSELLNMLAQLK